MFYNNTFLADTWKLVNATKYVLCMQGTTVALVITFAAQTSSLKLLICTRLNIHTIIYKQVSKLLDFTIYKFLFYFCGVSYFFSLYKYLLQWFIKSVARLDSYSIQRIKHINKLFWGKVSARKFYARVFITPEISQKTLIEKFFSESCNN